MGRIQLQTRESLSASVNYGREIQIGLVAEIDSLKFIVGQFQLGKATR